MTDPSDTAAVTMERIAEPTAARRQGNTVFAGYTAGQLLIGAAILVALIWSMWVTRSVIAEKPERIVKADLSRIVGEYVQAQARSATPPDQVQAQMRTFMAALDSELQRRGASGQVVLVGEAVLSKSVPDITADVSKAVYASGVKAPQPVSPAQMEAAMRGQIPAAPVPAPVQVAQAPAAPPASSPFAMPAPIAATETPVAEPVPSGASVSIFGGPGGQ